MGWPELNLREEGRRLGERLYPLGLALNRVGLTPNVLSILGLLFAAVSAFYAYAGDALLSGAFLALNLLFDVLDGITARAAGKETLLGGLMDKVFDRYSWLLLFAGLLLSHRVDGFWAAMAIYGSLIRGYISQRGEILGVKYHGIFSVTIGVRPILLIGLLSGMTNEAVIAIALANNALAIVQFLKIVKTISERRKP